MDLHESLRRLQWHMWALWRTKSSRSGELDLTSNELDYLYALLAAGEPLTPGTLAERMKVSRPSASVMAQKLEARGYIERVPGKRDKRSVLLRPTERCKTLERKERDVYAETARCIASVLKPNELTELTRLLAKGRAGLADDPLSGGEGTPVRRPNEKRR